MDKNAKIGISSLLICLCLCLSVLVGGGLIYFQKDQQPAPAPAAQTTPALVAGTPAPAAQTTPAPAPVTQTQKEVYHISGYNYPRSQAEGECQTFSGRLATKAELQDAQTKGADWCSTGWLKDETSAFYPITSTLITGCGNGSAGIKEYTPGQNAGINCYGVKPPNGTSNIAQFNINKWSYYDTPKEVYHLSGYNYTRSQAEGECQKFNGRLATKGELEAAQIQGADWCSTGWLKNETAAFYPITTSTQTGCGNGSPGIKEYTPGDNAGINCFGLKPPSGTQKIAPFNSTKWSL